MPKNSISKTSTERFTKKLNRLSRKCDLMQINLRRILFMTGAIGPATTIRYVVLLRRRLIAHRRGSSVDPGQAPVGVTRYPFL
jgi:hypothetical protein